MDMNGIYTNRNNVLIQRSRNKSFGNEFGTKMDNIVGNSPQTDEYISSKNRNNAACSEIYSRMNPLAAAIGGGAGESQTIEEEDLCEQPLDDESEEGKEQKSDSDSNIVVKPDGSRVLVITTKIGGMATQMSMEISKPTEFPLSKENTIEENISEGNMASNMNEIQHK